MHDPPLHDETALRWNFLEAESDPCVVVSERMEFVYVNEAAQALVPAQWFGKRCFEVLPVVDETCAFHCPKIDALSEGADSASADVVYCEETLYTDRLDQVVLGVGLIPLGTERTDRARAVFVLRAKEGTADPAQFEAQLLQDAARVRARILTSAR
ncbi:MAG: hypothetical protein QGG24_04495 [Vicinamibacterales bacterium]|jgi:PAS domain-containing protein|nr:hypothetical protein [Acidobacteriota bacterium]MDP7294559.1 hypothetical protein [Vicinamibacterales bacterium]MDP7470837.1 hypothetical protein [Vicinamibacterales bacterium]HJO37478.1 hypothetical protein [Vicinamibacterales bacterium]|tara:strand:+ start:1325 stop:1792 length:468 start_codon:yes stop_codon:yes gene_type:complete